MKTTDEWIEQVKQLSGIIHELVEERTELSLGSIYKEGLILKVFDPAIPNDTLVCIMHHSNVSLIGKTGKLNTKTREVISLDENGDEIRIRIKSINDVQSLLPEFQHRANVFFDNRIINCKYLKSKITPIAGSICLVNEHSGNIEAVMSYPEPTSNAMVTIVRRVIDENRIEIDANRTAFYFNMQLAEEDEVLVDQSGTIVLRKIKSNRLAGVSTTAEEINRTEWDDVIGLEDAKLRIIENIIQPVLHKDIYSKYGVGKLPKGMVLAGSPGCGKTMLGRAIATALADASGSKMSESGFVYVKSTELLDSYVGESEKRVRAIFSSASNHYDETGFPAVIFIDEADAILGTRGSHTNHSAHSLVAPFLTEMDGFKHQKSFVILATNRLDIIDPAITRNGRIDFKIQVNRPDKNTAMKILKSYLSRTVIRDDISELTNSAINKFWDDSALVGSKTVNGKIYVIYARDIVNGAMLKSIADEAITNAIRRDMKLKKKTVSGITKDDVDTAITTIISQNSILSNADVWEEKYRK